MPEQPAMQGHQDRVICEDCLWYGTAEETISGKCPVCGGLHVVGEQENRTPSEGDIWGFDKP